MSTYLNVSLRINDVDYYRRSGGGGSIETHFSEFLQQHVLRGWIDCFYWIKLWRDGLGLASFSDVATLLRLFHLSIVRINHRTWFIRVVHSRVKTFSFLPESLRWLLSQGKVDQVIENLKDIAKVNKKKVTDEVFKKFKVKAQQITEKPRRP